MTDPKDDGWKTSTYDISYLIDKAEEYGGELDGETAVDFLKVIGVIPYEVEKVKPVLALIDTDGTRLKAGYLAACAYEWDSWGDSRPIDFVKAIRLETKGYAGRDVIAETLTALGRTVTEEDI